MTTNAHPKVKGPPHEAHTNENIKYHQHSTIVNSFMKNNKQKEITCNKLLRGEIVAPIITILQKVRLGAKVDTLLFHRKNYPH